jgi:hypothetical protein
MLYWGMKTSCIYLQRNEKGDDYVRGKETTQFFCNFYITKYMDTFWGMAHG